MDLDEAVLRDWEDDEAFLMLSDGNIDFIDSSLQSQYDKESNSKVPDEASQKEETCFQSSHDDDDDLNYVIALSMQTDCKENSDGKLKDETCLQSFVDEDDLDRAIALSLQTDYKENSDSKLKDENFLQSLDDDLDFAIALSLQADYEEEKSDIKKTGVDPSKSSTVINPSKNLESLSIVDKQWELIDPNPDIHALFLEFDKKFFYRKLQGVEVRWSPRMYLCAGLCCYEGRGGLCSIRLSLPLLKLRPRQDLVETLLHEMIHAYLFVTHNNKDRESHGPEFRSHMNRINRETGTRISVYHSFHDEVDLYRQHWWKCDGPCKRRHPFYGIVKRTMNRAPGPNDKWWPAHQASCGGKFVKIKEPDNFKKKAWKRKTDPDFKGKESTSDIRSFIKVPKIGPNKNNSSRQVGTKSSNVSTITSVISQKDSVGPVKSKVIAPKKDLSPFKGSGFKLGGESNIPVIPSYLSKYSKESKSSTKQNWLSSSSGKSLSSGKSDAPSLFFKGSKGSNLKNKDPKPIIPSQVPDSPSKRLIQSPMEKYFSSKENSGMKDQLQRPDYTSMPKTEKSDIKNNECSKVSCPICSIKFTSNEINCHLDKCLLKN